MSTPSVLRSKSSTFARHLARTGVRLIKRKAAKPSGVRLCEINNVKLMLDLSTPMHRSIYIEKGFETEATTILHNMIRPGEVFVDIGANVGWYLLSILEKHCANMVTGYAFEPSKRMFAFLNDGIIANNCQSRCQAKRLAIGNRNGMTTLKTFKGLDPMAASLYPLADWPYEEEEVEITTLDSQAEAFSAPAAIIKCDVEGGERDVLLGAEGILSGKFGVYPVWFLEANYETAGMAGFFPWELIQIASRYAPYQGYYIRRGRIIPLPHHTALRHGDILILAIPELHHDRLEESALGHTNNVKI